MEKLIEVMTNMGMEQFAENTRQELVLSDQVILKDIPREQKMFVNDYIACMKTADDRYADISYAAGVKDTIRMLSAVGLLMNPELPE